MGSNRIAIVQRASLRAKKISFFIEEICQLSATPGKG